MQCKSLWIKASAKCINVNVNVTTGGLCRPTHLCVAHFKLHKKVSHSFFLWCSKVGGCLERGGMVHVSGGRGLHGVSEEGGMIWVQGSHSLGEKPVEQSGGAGSDAPVPSS